MSELLNKFEPGELIGLVTITGGMLVGLVATIMALWHEHRKTEINAALKQDMLNRGMTADEIRIVLDAGTRNSAKESRSQQLSNG
jgi:hypothetical protein